MSSKTELYKKNFNEESAHGLDAIYEKIKQIYGSQEPTHWATILPYELGGKDPLWAMEYYISQKQQNHLHFVSLGFSNLFYDESCADDEINGFGFEITFRYLPVKSEIEKPVWPANFLQNIARYVFKSEKAFDEYHYMSANGPIKADYDTEITAFAFFLDPELSEITTPHRRLKFLQLYGITTQEYNDIREKKYTVKELIDKHKESNPLLITDLDRNGKKKPFWKFF